jgi:aralkylamine N-acetyltransferase
MKMLTEKDAARITVIMIRVPTENQIHQIVQLYRMQGWWQAGDGESPHYIPRLIAGSHCFAVAVKEEEIVGMGRAISDGISDAYIQDVAVRDDFRKQGIGRRILQLLLDRLHADGLHWIGLIAEPGSDNLYRRAGFREMSSRIPMLLNGTP